MSDLGSTERHLLRALRAADEPSDDDRARVRARLLFKIAASSGIATAVATAATAPGAATAAGTATRCSRDGQRCARRGGDGHAPRGFSQDRGRSAPPSWQWSARGGGTAWIASSSKTSEPSAMAPQNAALANQVRSRQPREPSPERPGRVRPELRHSEIDPKPGRDPPSNAGEHDPRAGRSRE